MGIQANQTVKGVSVNNAYIKITRLNIQGTPRAAVAAKPAVGSTPAVAAVPAGTNWSGNVVVGVFANKTLADASSSNALSEQAVNLPNALTLPVGTNVISQVYTYLMTLPQYAGATVV